MAFTREDWIYLSQSTVKIDDPARAEITQLIHGWQSGDEQAKQLLFETLYRRLREIAAHCLKNDIRCQSLGPTELIHEAYVRLMESPHFSVANRSHFLALSAKVMRHIVVDRARARRSDKRGAAPRQVELLDSMLISNQRVEEILAIDHALEKLALENPRQGSVVELCFFGGFSLEDAGAVLGISERTAKREWQSARVWLKNVIEGKAKPLDEDKDAIAARVL